MAPPIECITMSTIECSYKAFSKTFNEFMQAACQNHHLTADQLAAGYKCVTIAYTGITTKLDTIQRTNAQMALKMASQAYEQALLHVKHTDNPNHKPLHRD